jgi:hypothetical protein
MASPIHPLSLLFDGFFDRVQIKVIHVSSNERHGHIPLVRKRALQTLRERKRSGFESRTAPAVKVDAFPVSVPRHLSV